MDVTARVSLDRQMGQVLAELAIVSNGRITAYNSAGGGDNNERVLPPTGDASPPHLHWALKYGEPFHACTQDCHHREQPSTDDDERQAVLDEARADLQKLRRGEPLDPESLESDEEARERMLHQTVGWTPEQIEHSSWPYNRFQVRRYRVAAGRHAMTGEALVETEGDDDQDPREHAQRLASQGMTERQIAFRLGKHKTQIRRWLGRAA